MGPGVEGLMDDEGDAGGEVSEASSVEVSVVDVGCGDAAGCVNDGVVSFGGCCVEIENVANGGTEMAQASVCDDWLTLGAEGGRGGGCAASSSASEGMLGVPWRRGLVRIIWSCCGCVGIAWRGGRERCW